MRSEWFGTVRPFPHALGPASLRLEDSLLRLVKPASDLRAIPTVETVAATAVPAEYLKG